MSSNLPPGCSESDIPGNRPIDIQEEKAVEELLDCLDRKGIHWTEYRILLDAGIVAVKAAREYAEVIRQEAIQNERLEHTSLYECFDRRGRHEADKQDRMEN